MIEEQEALLERLSYGELANGIADGTIGGEFALQRLLILGYGEFSRLADDPASPFKETFKQLAEEHLNAAKTNNLKGFCLNQAGYLLGLAKTVGAQGGKPNEISALEMRAQNWQNALSTKTQTATLSRVISSPMVPTMSK